MNDKQNSIEDYKVIEEFLSDIDCLAPLDNWNDKFNPFNVLNITRSELRHSDMIAWLLNPNENHGLHGSILDGFIAHAGNEYGMNSALPLIYNMGYQDFKIYREWNNIDIMVCSDKNRFILCIENKIDSWEHDNQLQRYQQLIEEKYTEYAKLFIYLTPKGIVSTDTEHWCSMSYTDLLHIIERAIEKADISSNVGFFIKNYVDIIRREIVGDKELARICAEIYAKHKRALDLIYANKEGFSGDLTEILKNWAMNKTNEGKIEYIPNRSVKTYIRFKTEVMTDLFPDVPGTKSGWNTSNHYFYEIHSVDGNVFYIQLGFSGKDMPAEQKELCERIQEYYPDKNTDADWKWRNPFVSSKSCVEDLILEENIFAELDQMLDEIQDFEKELLTLLGRNISEETLQIFDESATQAVVTDTKIDVTFDFTTDTPDYWVDFWTENDEISNNPRKDPDYYSPTMKEYHRILWSKPLPNGQHMQLEAGKSGYYLKWNDMYFGSDAIIVSFRYNQKLMDQVREQVPSFRDYIEDFWHKSYTIGGEIIFPMHRQSINQRRGMSVIIKDRFDLTLECIRRYYKGEDSPLSKVLERDKDFFDLFVDFKGYVDFFFLNDLVTEDYSKVHCWCGDMSMTKSGMPENISDYWTFIDKELEFLERRNQRIKQYCEEHGI